MHMKIYFCAFSGTFMSRYTYIDFPSVASHYGFSAFHKAGKPQIVSGSLILHTTILNVIIHVPIQQ